MTNIDQTHIDFCIEKDAVVRVELAEIEKTAHELRNQLRGIAASAFLEKYGIDVGVIVKDKSGKLYRVTTIELLRISGTLEFRLRCKPWVKGNPIKADGTYGVSERNLYDDWEVV